MVDQQKVWHCYHLAPCYRGQGQGVTYSRAKGGALPSQNANEREHAQGSTIMEATTIYAGKLRPAVGVGA